MISRLFPSLVVVVALLSGHWEPAARQSPQAKPDVFLIVLDTVRRDHLSLYGYSRRTTPKLDARRGRLRYFDATSPAPQTAPSVASVFTGVPPRVHGLQFDAAKQTFATGAVPLLREPLVTLAQKFKTAGYTTLGVTANPWILPEGGFNRGFDTFVGWRAVDPELPNDGQRVVSQVSGWLDTAASSPRFVYAHFMDAHAPYAKGHQEFVKAIGKEISINGRSPAAPDDLRYMIDLYDSDILYLDALLDRLFARLDAGGRPWVAAVVGDHGEEFHEHGGFGHGTTLHEELLRVPAIFTGSHVIDRDGASPYPLQLTDVHDLLLAASGVQGSPMLGLLSTRLPQPRLPANRHITSELTGMAALRQGDWKYVVTQQPFSEALYDLKKDRLERRNVAANERARIAGFRKEGAVNWPMIFLFAPRGEDEE